MERLRDLPTLEKYVEHKASNIFQIICFLRGWNCVVAQIGTQLLQVCSGPSCASSYWATSPWGACNVTCGGGFATRDVACVDGSGTAAAPSACASLLVPPASRQCNTASCIGYTWQVEALLLICTYGHCMLDYVILFPEHGLIHAALT